MDFENCDKKWFLWCCARALVLISTSTGVNAQMSFSPPGCEYTLQIPAAAKLGKYSSSNGACETHYAILSAHDESTELAIECTICSTYTDAAINKEFAFQSHREMANQMGWEIIAESFDALDTGHISYMRASSNKGRGAVYLQTLFGRSSFLNIRLEAAVDDFSEAFKQSQSLLRSITQVDTEPLRNAFQEKK